jgi:hypothetical protein
MRFAFLIEVEAALDLWPPIKDFIATHPEIVVLAELVLAISSVVMAVILYKLSKSPRLLAYATRTFRLVPEKRIKLERMKITYNGSPVESLSVTWLAIWNGGSESIRRSDLATKAPPVIYAPEGISLFEMDIIETSAAANNVSLTPVYNPLIGSAIDFDFLDPGDGAVFSVVHSGSKVADIRLNGEIIGGRIRRTVAHGETPTEKSGQQWDGSTSPIKPESGRSSTRRGAYAILILLPIVGLLLLFTSEWRGGLLLIMLGLIVPTGVLLLSRRVYPPLRLKSFDKNLGDAP